jgi:hypothetical protein
MLDARIGHARLYSQQISAPRATTPAAVVAWLGAMQAQDYLGVLWAIGLRMAPEVRATEALVEAAIADRSIVRTWPLRGTLHLVAAADIRWILELLGPRSIAQSASRLRELGIDEQALVQSRGVVESTLAGGQCLTREELFARLQAAGVATTGQRGVYILSTLSHQGVLCFAARRARQFTFALLDEWLLPSPRMARDEALVELARRYFQSHGPATVQDFARWAGLTLGDARAGLDGATPGLVREIAHSAEYWMDSRSAALLGESPVERPVVHLLPGFDEFLLGYADREAVVERDDEERYIHPGGNGIFFGTVVARGRVIGTWKRTLKARSVRVAVDLFAELETAEEEAVEAAANRYGAYLGFAATLQWGTH